MENGKLAINPNTECKKAYELTWTPDMTSIVFFSALGKLSKSGSKISANL